MTPPADTYLAQLAVSSALWNRKRLDLDSDETLAQLLDRGSLDDWRALYALAGDDAALAGRIAALVATVPLPTVWFWRAALANLGVSPGYAEAPVDEVWT